MKGQSQFIGYVFTVLFSIIVLAGISALVYTFYRNSIEQEAKNELTQIAVGVKDNLIKLYDLGKNSKIQPSNQTSTILGEATLDLPKKVVNQNYEVDLVTSSSLFSYITVATINGTNITGIKNAGVAKIVARTTSDPIVSIENDLPNLDISVQGKFKNGENGVLRYYRNNENSTVYDTVILGQSDIIIKITSIS